MSKTLQALRADHTNFRRLLGLLEGEMARFRQDKKPDYELMRDALVYITQYADRVHHPAEDVVFEHLEKRDASLQAAVTGMMAEHERVIASGSELLRMFEEVLGDAMMSRADVAAAAGKYLEAMRQHIDREETELFPAAERVLKPADWKAIDASSREQHDPLFGANVDPQYRALLDRLPR